jgi:DNA-binding PadR family transcriptional regulator
MSETAPEPKDFLPLHPLELRILLVLAEGDAHGYGLVKQIEARETRLPRIYSGNLYRRIRDLLRKGLVEDARPPDDPEVDARRRYFRMTGLGRDVLLAEAARIDELAAETKRLHLSSQPGRAP